MPQHVIIGGELEPRGMSGVALDAKYIIDRENNGLNQSDINSTVETLAGASNFVTIPATSTDTSIGAVFTRVSITPATDTLYRIGNWKHDGSPQYNVNYYSVYGTNSASIGGLVPVALSENGIDDNPTPGSTNLVSSGGVAASIVYDISAAHAGAVYETLADALGTGGNNIPEPLRKGGISVKFIQGSVSNSDNYYVQYRCIPNEFTTDVTKWAICDDEVLVENPEFIEAKTDLEGKVLEGTKKDGTKYIASGLQVKGKIDNEELDEAINSKIDKVNPDTNVNNEDTLGYFEPIENSEWLSVETDSEGKVLGGRKKDGTKVENTPQENPVAIEKYVDNSEYIILVLDADNKIVKGVKKKWNRSLLLS